MGGAGGKREGQGTTGFPRPLVVHWTGHDISTLYRPEHCSVEDEGNILAHPLGKV